MYSESHLTKIRLAEVWKWIGRAVLTRSKGTTWWDKAVILAEGVVILTKMMAERML